MNYICVGTPINLPGGLLTPVRNEGIFTLVLRESMEFGCFDRDQELDSQSWS